MTSTTLHHIRTTSIKLMINCFSCPYVVKHTIGLHIAGQQTVVHQLSGPYVVKLTDSHRTAGQKTVLINSLVVLTTGIILMVILLVTSGHSEDHLVVLMW
jgi:hypothetical protein